MVVAAAVVSVVESLLDEESELLHEVRTKTEQITPAKDLFKTFKFIFVSQKLAELIFLISESMRTEGRQVDFVLQLLIEEF